MGVRRKRLYDIQGPVSVAFTDEEAKTPQVRTRSRVNPIIVIGHDGKEFLNVQSDGWIDVEGTKLFSKEIADALTHWLGLDVDMTRYVGRLVGVLITVGPHIKENKPVQEALDDVKKTFTEGGSEGDKREEDPDKSGS